MSNTAEPTEPFREQHFKADATPLKAARPSPAGDGKTKSFGGLGLKAAARAAATPKLTRVVGMAFVGLALGGVCGLWLHARLAAASLLLSNGARPALVARLAEGPSLTPSAAPESTPDGGRASTSSPADATPTPGPEAPLSAEVLATQPALNAVGGRGEERGAARGKETKDSAEVMPRADAQARREAATTSAPAPKAVNAGGRPAPCAIYASTNSLSFPSGGSAPLILGGPGPFIVTTPDWSNIAVFSEGRTGGGKNGWTKYAVRSVSKRAGVYTLHVKSPCDSQTIRVRVTPL